MGIINKNNSKKVKRIPLLFALIIAASGILSTLSPSSSFAAATPLSFNKKLKDMTPSEQSLSMQYVETIANCFSQPGFGEIPKGKDGNNDNPDPSFWFQSYRSNVAYINGYVKMVGGIPSSCVSVTKDAFALWQWSGNSSSSNYKDFLGKILGCTSQTITIGYDNWDSTIAGDAIPGYMCPKPSDPKPSAEKFLQKVMKDVYDQITPKKVDGIDTYNIQLSPGAEYKYWYDVFQKSCAWNGTKTSSAPSATVKFDNPVRRAPFYDFQNNSVPKLYEHPDESYQSSGVPAIGTVYGTIVLPSSSNGESTPITYEDWYIVSNYDINTANPALKITVGDPALNPDNPDSNSSYLAKPGNHSMSRSFYGAVYSGSVGAISANSPDKNPGYELYGKTELDGLVQGINATCHDILKKMDNKGDLYKAYSAYLKATGSNPDAPKETGGEQPIKLTPPVVHTPTPTTTTSTCGINVIGWLVCPVLNFMAGIADGAFGFISNNFLEIKPSLLNSDPTAKNDKGTLIGTPTYDAWAIMRNIANVAFVIVFLIIIFSQLTNIGVTNYGIKKMLPRLVIAAVLVNVSYLVCQVVVDLSNILGYSLSSFLQSLTTAPVPTFGPSQAGALDGLVFEVVAVATGAIVWFSLATLIPVLIAAVVALVMILFILVARQAIIIMLVVISPLAFVAFLLPNTEDWFKKWRKALMSMLMLFPIIALVFGMSKLSSSIIGNAINSSTGSGDNMGQIIAAGVLVLPLFVVPGLLKKSIDAVGGIGGKLAGLGDRAGKSLGKLGSKGYENTALARGRAIKTAAKADYRNQKFAKALGKEGGWRRRAALGGPAFTKGGLYAQGQIERTALAKADEIKKKEISDAELQFKSQVSAPADVPKAAQIKLEEALYHGDEITARAMTNALMTAGAAGRTRLHRAQKNVEERIMAENPRSAEQIAIDNARGDSRSDEQKAIDLASGIDSRTANEITRDNARGFSQLATFLKSEAVTGIKKEALAKGIKANDIMFDKFATSNDSLISHDTVINAADFSGLTSAELATQDINTLEIGIASGALSVEQAISAIANPTTRNAITGDKAAVFATIPGIGLTADQIMNYGNTGVAGTPPPTPPPTPTP